MREIEVRDGNKFIGAYPASGYAVAYKINFAAPIGEQSFEIDLSQDLYRKELAAARTFGFLSEEKAMKDMGLDSRSFRRQRDCADGHRSQERSAAL